MHSCSGPIISALPSWNASPATSTVFKSIFADDQCMYKESPFSLILQHSTLQFRCLRTRSRQTLTMVNVGSLLTGVLAALASGAGLVGAQQSKPMDDLYAGISESLRNPAPQDVTNGRSKWGTFEAPTYPQYLSNNPMPNGKPWGSLTADKSNPYEEAPYTGVTRHYKFEISRMDMAPDGVVKNMMVVNQQFPGPTIEANWGDWIEGTIGRRRVAIAILSISFLSILQYYNIN